jgi:hypothetical protein
MRRTITQAIAALAVTALLFVTASAETKKNCQPAGGMLMTNFGAVDPNTTMGVATGDLKGAVAATILNIDGQIGGPTLVFTVQHHWVTDSGDTLMFAPAKATANQVEPNSLRYGVVTYPVHLSGGTGKFASATGDLDVIGEADLATGQLVFRYSGTICYAQKN